MITGLPKEVLDSESVQHELELLKKRFNDIFSIIDNEVIPSIGEIENVPDEVSKLAVPMIKIQYANLLQMAFMDVYKNYISKASEECTENLIINGFSSGKD